MARSDHASHRASDSFSDGCLGVLHQPGLGLIECGIGRFADDGRGLDNLVRPLALRATSPANDADHVGIDAAQEEVPAQRLELTRIVPPAPSARSRRATSVPGGGARPRATRRCSGLAAWLRASAHRHIAGSGKHQARSRSGTEAPQEPGAPQNVRRLASVAPRPADPWRPGSAGATVRAKRRSDRGGDREEQRGQKGGDHRDLRAQCCAPDRLNLIAGGATLWRPR